MVQRLITVLLGKKNKKNKEGDASFPGKCIPVGTPLKVWPGCAAHCSKSWPYFNQNVPFHILVCQALGFETSDVAYLLFWLTVHLTPKPKLWTSTWKTGKKSFWMILFINSHSCFSFRGKKSLVVPLKATDAYVFPIFTHYVVKIAMSRFSDKSSSKPMSFGSRCFIS